MQKRAILAIILAFLIIIGWSYIQSKFFPPPTQIEEKKEITKEKKVEKPLDIKETIPPLIQKTQVKTKDIIKKEISVETRNYLATITSEGARIKHFKLKNYRDRVEESEITIKFTKFIQNIFGHKVDFKKPQLLDLINTSEQEGFPLDLDLGILKTTFENWDVDKEKIILLKQGEKDWVNFEKSFENGLKVIKRFGFLSDKDRIELEVEIYNLSDKDIPLQLGINWIGKVELLKMIEEGNKDYGLKYAFIKGQNIETKNFGGGGASGCTPGCSSPKKKIEPFEITEKGEIKWYAFEGEYFASIIIPSKTENITLKIKGNENNVVEANLLNSPITLPQKASIKIPYTIYIGPKRDEQLKSLGVGAERLIDFGFFTVVAKPMLWFLKLTNRLTKNFGIDIIILSILIKIIFLPLTQISYKSMKEMQKIQPEMARLKEMYKDDKAKLQQELMLLYKRRRINPLSGCLPMLIQIPVFIALYNALQNAIEMRHAPFFLWIKDLSAKDPIYITPIIMGASMVIQQKMTPTTADPAQAKLFLLMPIMFTFLFLNFPSGLVLYWLVNNILSIAHQYYLNKKI
jgi:YidC/Oxa1 family membrane protein insertase